MPETYVRCDMLRKVLEQIGPVEPPLAKGAVMQEVTLEEAQLHLAEIIAKLSPGAEVLIVAGSKAIATIRSTELLQQHAPRQLGTLKGSVKYIAPDFDSIPPDFEDLLG